MSEKKLFEVVIKAYKVFYVEAETQDEAYDMEVLSEESTSNNHWAEGVDWEHDETDVSEISTADAWRIKNDPQRAKKILKDDV